MAEVHKKAYPKTTNNNKIIVKVDTLDNLLLKKLWTNEGRILLKIDVQGAEELVLQGAEEILKLTDIIFIELNFSETYKGCIKVNELVKILETFGFVLYGIENVSQSIYDGSFLQADAFFIKKHLEKIINADK